MNQTTMQKTATKGSELLLTIETNSSLEMGAELRRFEQEEHERQERVRTEDLARLRAVQTFD